ncbi:molybdopterin-dependent oxidoreductase [Anoxynatronum buryatiense]|uniref:Formate dehydrogenase major subunit n=1 Tax=Anoxynatronum buryatiense TaxID=489973 RepID=A0AA45WYC7_9CLOT|nr:molybdopterin-dependent oxidoreductase [Anoxynatronum buryatiense]SMP68151.1 formate dehydrogenase major subunit [Anoxynatronum buryatiense]
MSELRLNINGKEVTGRRGQTILEVARENDISIPTLCYDDRMKIYGSCGLCVVEAEGIPKLLRACATEISPDMVIKTNTEKLKANRKIALELLLSDHTGDCRPPCVLACPGKTDCQGYVGLIANGEHKESLKLIKEQLPLPASIGRVCPHPCEDECRRQLKDEPIAIAWHKRFVADLDLQDPEVFMPELKPATGKSVAIVGGGPGGLSTAYYLLTQGHAVTIYDMMPEMGGMLKYGIPQYRLPKEVLNQEIAVIEKMGARMVNNVRVGEHITLDYLRSHFDAVYLSIGCWESSPMRCPGEELEGVMGGIHFLRNVVENRPTHIGQRVAVVGGGNTAMDACRTAIRLGAKEVINLYRRTREEMPAEEIEIVEAEEEGVTFKFLVSPIEVLGENGKATAIRLQKMELGEPDASGRRRPVPVEGAEEILEVDSIIVAIGQYVNLDGFEEIDKTKYSTISVDPKTFSTSLPGVFAGGDAINDNLKIAIQAIGDGKNAYKIIDGYLNGVDITYKAPYLVTRDDVTAEEFEDRPTAKRSHMGHLSAEERRDNFKEVVHGFTPEEAIADAKRCLECGCHDYFECKLIDYSNQYEVEPERLAGEMHHRTVEDSHPFIHRNPDKCILCGLCVRVCHEVMDVTALGLVDRGFDAVVKPAMDRPLKESDCISCGQCVSVCPTGALQEKLLLEKSVPVETHTTDTLCSYCSVGCQTRLETKGGMVVRSLPISGNPVDGGLLCVKGRFGYDLAQRQERLTTPLIRKNGRLEEATWEEALLLVAKKAQGFAFQEGSDSVGIAVSDTWTNEDLFAVKRFAEDVMKTPHLFSLNNTAAGIGDVLGLDASPNTLTELLRTEVILLVGSAVMRDHAIAGLKIKEAVQENGAKLITINPCATKADEWATLTIQPENQVTFLKEMAAALLESGKSPAKADGLEALKASLAGLTISDAAREAAALYGNAKTGMIVFDQKALSPEAAQMLANLAVISGHIGKPRRGLIQLKPGSNSQALSLMNITGDARNLESLLAEKTLKALLVFGEDYPQESLKSLEFLAVMDTHLTPTAQMAQVVLPAASFAESQGTYTSLERRIQPLAQALKPLAGLENWQVIARLAAVLRMPLGYESMADVARDLGTTQDGYDQVHQLQASDAYWPLGQNPMLYDSGFAFEDGLARLAVVADAPLFVDSPSTRYVNRRFSDYLAQEGLDRC